LTVTLDFTEDCWVEASVDGRRRLSELHVQGESLQIDAQERVELTLGNPRGVAVEVNGEPYSLADYRPGRVARDIVITVEGGV
jgi:sulfur carrier protein ThiS